MFEIGSSFWTLGFKTLLTFFKAFLFSSFIFLEGVSNRTCSGTLFKTVKGVSKSTLLIGFSIGSFLNGSSFFSIFFGNSILLLLFFSSKLFLLLVSFSGIGFISSLLTIGLNIFFGCSLGFNCCSSGSS